MAKFECQTQEKVPKISDEESTYLITQILKENHRAPSSLIACQRKQFFVESG